MNHQLELISEHGDETFARLAYLVHGVATSFEVGQVMEHGLSARAGEAAGVSASLADAEGHILILRRPSQPYVGYAATTSAVIDRAAHTVSGNPLAYASSRRQLAWYTNSEAKLTDTEKLAGAPSLVVSSDYLIGWIEPNLIMATTLNQLEIAASSLVPIPLVPLEAGLIESITFAPSATQVVPLQLAHALLIASIESIILSHLRLMRWQGLALAGYSFTEAGAAITIPTPSTHNEQQRRINELQARLNGESLLVGELAWLRPHTQAAITIMNNELREIA